MEVFCSLRGVNVLYIHYNVLHVQPYGIAKCNRVHRGKQRFDK